MEKELIGKINKYAERLEKLIVEAENEIWENDYEENELQLVKFKKEIFEIMLAELESMFEDVLYP